MALNERTQLIDQHISIVLRTSRRSLSVKYLARWVGFFQSIGHVRELLHASAAIDDSGSDIDASSTIFFD